MAIRINGRVYNNWDKLKIETLARADTKQATYDEKNKLRQYVAFRGQMESLKSQEKAKLAEEKRKAEEICLREERYRKHQEQLWNGMTKSLNIGY